MAYKDMIDFENNEELIEMQGLQGIPVNYRNITIYPVKVRDVVKFNATIGLLTINKNETGQLEIIKMSYLDYLINLFLKDFSFYKGFKTILELTIKATNIKFVADNIEFDFDKEYISNSGEKIELGYLQGYLVYTQLNNKKSKKRIRFTINNKEHSLTFFQFDQLRKKICEVNNIQISENILPQKFRQALEKAKKYKQQENSMSWGQTIVALASLENNNTNLEKYLDMTIYHFMEAIKRHDIIQESVFEGIARRTGLIEIKKPITWLYDHKTEDNELSGLVTDGNELSKMAQALK